MSAEPSQTALNNRVTITRFAHKKAPQGEQVEIDGDFFAKPAVIADKDAAPLFTFARHNGNYRKVENFIDTSVLGFDLDVVPYATEEDIRAALVKLGCGGIYHTSHSATPDTPKWHLFIVTTRPMSDAEYREMHARVRAMFPFGVGEAAKDSVRAWFIPVKSSEGAFYRSGQV